MHALWAAREAETDRGVLDGQEGREHAAGCVVADEQHCGGEPGVGRRVRALRGAGALLELSGCHRVAGSAVANPHPVIKHVQAESDNDCRAGPEPGVARDAATTQIGERWGIVGQRIMAARTVHGSGQSPPADERPGTTAELAVWCLAKSLLQERPDVNEEY